MAPSEMSFQPEGTIIGDRSGLSGMENNNYNRIFLSRHGESLNNLFGKIGGNASLSSQGQIYSKALMEFTKGLHLNDLKVWNSELVRTIETVKLVKAECNPISVETQPALNEVDAGEHNNLTYEEIAEMYPVEFAKRDEDKLRYRYPAGESYEDVLLRLQPLIKKMRTENNLLVVAHQATLRCVLGLLFDKPREEVPYTRVPLHTVLEVRIPVGIDQANKIEVVSHPLSVSCVNTYRAKPSNCNTSRDIMEACTTIPQHMTEAWKTLPQHMTEACTTIPQQR